MDVNVAEETLVTNVIKQGKELSIPFRSKKRTNLESRPRHMKLIRMFWKLYYFESTLSICMEWTKLFVIIF